MREAESCHVAVPRDPTRIWYLEVCNPAQTFSTPKSIGSPGCRLQIRNCIKSRQASTGLSKGPYCAQCEWDQSHAQIDKVSLKNYFETGGSGVFNSDSTSILSSW